jgi:hypothetical protein
LGVVRPARVVVTPRIKGNIVPAANRTAQIVADFRYGLRQLK